MQMTPEEIVRHYTHAANKHQDIKVLAELNMVTPAEIRSVLAESGVEGIEAPKRIARRKKRLPALRRSLPRKTDRRYTRKSRTSSPPCPAIWAKRLVGPQRRWWRRCSRSI